MEEKYMLSKSCETYVLENEVILSAFPGFIVFGKTESNKYFLENCSFKLRSFQVKYLFKSIIAIFAFFSDELVQQKTEKIIDIDSDLIYYWQGISVTKDNNLTKAVKFGIEKEQNNIFHVLFTLQDLNNFIFVITRCLLASLCLKDEDEEFIMEFTKNSRNDILACKNDEVIAAKLVKFYTKNQKSENVLKQRPLIVIVQYYNELILLMKDLSDLHFNG
jgi:hypothetical protein